MAIPLAVFSLLVALGAPAQAPEPIEFSGYQQARGATQFVLVDPATKTNSGWITLGANFGGYTLVGFDVKTETLEVVKAGEVSHLRLKIARLIAGMSDLPVSQAEIDAGLAQPLPSYRYNQQRGTYEVVGFTWRRLTPAEIEAQEKARAEAQAAAAEKAKAAGANGETSPAASASAEKR